MSNLSNLSKMRIVLVETSHPGNIGSTARAMKNMGLSQLVLVSPKAGYRSTEANSLAVGAEDILINAQVVDSLEAALSGCTQVYACSARDRSLSWPAFTVREAAQHAVLNLDSTTQAFVFGPERSGLSNQHLRLAQYHMSIPANPDYSSLNLSQAVQIVAYEIRMAVLDKTDNTKQEHITRDAPLATADELLGFLSHLEQICMAVHFLDPKQPKLLTGRLKRIFDRASLDQKEINILRGLCSAIQRKLDRIVD